MQLILALAERLSALYKKKYKTSTSLLENPRTCCVAEIKTVTTNALLTTAPFCCYKNSIQVKGRSAIDRLERTCSVSLVAFSRLDVLLINESRWFDLSKMVNIFRNRSNSVFRKEEQINKSLRSSHQFCITIYYTPGRFVVYNAPQNVLKAG